MAKAAYPDVAEMRDLFSHDRAEWKPIVDEGSTDMRYVAGDPWEPADREARRKAGRVALSLDELSQYVNQGINDLRMNKRAVKFAPVGNGANDDTANFYADKMREIEYRSRATIGYITAAENMFQRSYGFVRVNSRYAHSRATAQDLWIDPVPNPDLITPDTSALMPDLSDMQHCWVREAWGGAEFDRKWKKYKVGAGKDRRAAMKEAPDWIHDDRTFLGEFWKIKSTTRKLLIVEQEDGDPIGIFADEVDGELPGAVLREEEREDRAVCQYLTNGVEILEKVEWPGKYIPIIGCLGKVLFVDDGSGAKRKILSMVRLARDPYMLYCYYRTCEAELVGMTPKFPYFAYKGQLDPTNLVNLQKSLHEPVAVVEVDPSPEGMALGTVLPHPQRQPYDPPIQALEIGAEAARRAIQAAMGQTPLPTAAQRRNEKSGVALERIEELGQRGSFHFVDHYTDMITQVGIVVEDLLDKVYDTARTVGVRKANDDAESVRINDPAQKDAVSTKGDHLVTVSTGPSFESEREAAESFAMELVGQPGLMALLGPLVVKLKNLGPIGDEMAELLELVQPPAVQAHRQQKEKAGDPASAQRQLAQATKQLQDADQLLQMAQAKIQELEQEKAADVTKNEFKVLSDQIKGELQAALQAIKGRQAMEQQNDQQAHELALKSADAAAAQAQAEQAAKDAEKAAAQGHVYSVTEAGMNAPTNGAGA